jgi:hypothetical protein
MEALGYKRRGASCNQSSAIVIAPNERTERRLHNVYSPQPLPRKYIEPVHILKMVNITEKIKE